MADKRSKQWKGNLEDLPKMKCRIWSLKSGPGQMSWSGNTAEIIYVDNKGLLSVHIGDKTFLLHINSVILQIQDSENITKEENVKTDTNAMQLLKKSKTKRIK